MASSATETQTSNGTQSLTGEEWTLDIAITDAPRPIVSSCDTGDGCASTCASSCAS
ncbi:MULTISPECIES: FxLD family lanthipeptide [unclassified Streptomyces]|uniref:FxLD family lanthipeptide n=1 Tax=unclassified Streptomyces TaxID=2593676 RepID=UPI000823C128|nr:MULTISPECIES: FxLD family lanthipeptide [unclassified Streptomyces]MYU02161.1 FxLD family lantipeptide [Streptomyces sp. SID8350]SCK61711.1 FxLD family lantipeptide [Streptomyces sp. AmelKG-D3]